MTIIGVTKTLRVADLKIPTEYHTGVHPGHAERLAGSMQEGFDERRFGLIAVAERDDGLYVVDGVQRVAALKLIGVEEVAGTVLSGMTLEDEARLFLTRNSGTRLV